MASLQPWCRLRARAAMEAEQAKEERARCRCGSHCHWPASVQPLPLCSLCLSASLRARITLRAWHVFSAAEHAKEELLRKKRRLKLVKNKKLEDKSKIHKVWLEDECGPILTQVNSFVIPRRTKLNGDQWVAVD